MMILSVMKIKDLRIILTSQNYTAFSLLFLAEHYQDFLLLALAPY